MTHHHAAVGLLTFLFIGSGTTWAQTQRSGGGGESQRFMQQYQQLAAEKTALQAQLAQMKKDLDASRTDLTAMTKERDALKARPRAVVSPAVVAQLKASKEAAERNLDTNKQRTAELVTKFRDMAGSLSEVEADRGALRVQFQQRDAAFDKCASDNLQLFELTNAVLDRYEHVGMFTRVSATEPFTRITRTRIENLVDEYRERAMQLREKKPVASPPVPAPAPAPPPAPAPSSTRSN